MIKSFQNDSGLFQWNRQLFTKGKLINVGTGLLEPQYGKLIVDNDEDLGLKQD